MTCNQEAASDEAYKEAVNEKFYQNYSLFYSSLPSEHLDQSSLFTEFAV